jgi:N-dimethylarginine dimethylaminohydrolase
MPEASHPLDCGSDYDKLKEVVVGIADDFTLPPSNPSLTHYNDEVQAILIESAGKPLEVKSALPERHEKTAEQLDSLAALYEARGIAVRRARAYTEEEKKYLGPLQEGLSLLYPADPVFVIGKHFLELNIRRAYRRKEVFPLREAVMPLIENDAEARHVAMPAARPFDPSYGGPGPYLEGGDIMITGTDILVGESEIASNRAGTDWLKRYIEPYGYRVHPLPMKGDILHALGAMCLLREGLLMAYLPTFTEPLPEPIKDWEIIELTEQEAHSFATVGVSLDDKTYVLPAGNNRVVDELDRRGIEPVPLPFDHVGFWGGSVSCATLPLARE